MKITPNHLFQTRSDASAESLDTPLEGRELLQNEYIRALEIYAFRRGEKILSAKAMYPADSDMEIIGRAGIEKMQASYNLLESVTSPNTIDDGAESMCTVTIPVAILNEDIDAVVSVVKMVGQSHNGEAMPLDVVLWANAKYTSDNKTDIESDALNRYGELVEKLRSITGGQLRIKSALQLIPEADFSMSKLRSNYMDAVALDALDRGYGFNHPAMWIDADMTHIARGTIKELSKPLRDIDALVTHANLQFTVDWASGESINDLDDSTRAVIFHEAQRRQLNWIQSSDDSTDYSQGNYPEECGLAFTIGAYLMGGGVDTEVALNESSYLIENIKRGFPEFSETILGFGFEKNGHLPRYDIEYHKTARMGVSARRHYEVAKQKGAAGLYDVDKSGYGGTLFTDMNRTGEAKKIYKGAVRELFANTNANWYKHALGETVHSSEVEQRLHRNEKLAYRVIERYFKD